MMARKPASSGAPCTYSFGSGWRIFWFAVLRALRLSVTISSTRSMFSSRSASTKLASYAG